MAHLTHNAPGQSANGPRRILLSTAFRLALLYIGLFGGSMLALLAVIYWTTAGYIAQQTEETIEAEVQGLTEQYARLGLPALIDVLARRIEFDPNGSSVYLLVQSNGTPVVGNIDHWPSIVETHDGWLTFHLANSPQDDNPRTARARAFLLRGDFRLLVGRDMREMAAVRRLAGRALGWGLTATVLLALFGGILMSRASLRRLEAIMRAFRPIMAGDLTRRVPSGNRGDDLDQLADGINEMLARIEVLMESVRQVSGHIAHDLRTPLTRLRARLEGLRDKNASTEQAMVVDAAIADADTLLSTFTALLRIARIEAGSGMNTLPVDLPAILADAVELYEPLALERRQEVSTALLPGITVMGDRDLLFQMVTNLLDNAVKYTPEGGHIHVSLERCNGTGRLVIADSGPGIAVAEREKVLQHFYRTEASRSTPGNGLGLSLVAAVARLHRGTIRLEDNQPGLRVVLNLPIYDAAQEGEGEGGAERKQAWPPP